MNYQSTLKTVKSGNYNYIYLYFKHKGSILRVNTGNKVIDKCMTKDLLYNSKLEGYKELNTKTLNLKKKVDEYLRHKLVVLEDSKISQDECNKFIKGEPIPNYRIIPHSKIPKTKGVNDYLKEFYTFKIVELNNRPSYKDYLTLTNSLLDFQKYYKIRLTFDYLNSEIFLVKYRNFLSIDRGIDYKKEGYKTRGGLNDNTINKRFSSLETFFLWIERQDIYTFKKSVHSFKIPKYDNDIIVLDSNDIKKLNELKIENPTWEKIRDLFVFNCYCGLRVSDLMTLTQSNFHKDKEGDYILIQENQKTKITVYIPLQKTSLNILLKYNFDLPKFSFQHFNREIKNILEHYDLMGETIIKKRRSNKENQDKEFKRRDLITSHTCRKTFITLGISNNVPINSLMNATGHKKIQTLQKSYMKMKIDKESFKRIDS